jgi:hypothetical protein
LASVGASATILLNQQTGALITVPGSGVASTQLRRGLVPDDGCQCGTARTAGRGRPRQNEPHADRRAQHLIDTVDGAALPRYELPTQAGNSLPAGQVNFLLYDQKTATAQFVETGPQSLINLCDGWAWWLTGDFRAPTWHLLNLTQP